MAEDITLTLEHEHPQELALKSGLRLSLALDAARRRDEDSFFDHLKEYRYLHPAHTFNDRTFLAHSPIGLVLLLESESRDHPARPGWITRLVKLGADINALAEPRYIPLELAWVNASCLFDEVLAAKPNIDQMLQTGTSMLISSVDRISEQVDLETLQKVLAHGADPNQRRPDDGWTAAHILVADGGYPTDRTLTDAVLQRAAAGVEGTVAGLRLLRAAGADVNLVDGKGRSPLVLAAGGLAPASPAIHELVQLGADVAQADWHGLTALHHARSPEAVRILVAAGADPNARDRWGRTPLFYHVQTHKQEEVLTALLSAGADPDLSCYSHPAETGRTMIEKAKRRSGTALRRVLQAHDAKRAVEQTLAAEAAPGLAA